MTTDPADIIERILRQRGPMDNAALLDAVRREGVAITDADLDDVLHDEIPMVQCLPGGEHGMLDDLLVGRVLTHRVTEDEITLNVLQCQPDMGALTSLLDEGSELLALPDGPLEWGTDTDDERVVSIEEAGVDPDEVIALPPGTLTGLEPGTVVGIRFGPDGAAVSPVLPDAPPDDLRGRVDALIRESHADDAVPEAGDDLVPDSGDAGDESRGTTPMPIPIGSLLLALGNQDPTLFTRPLPPIGELLEQWGFTIVDGEAGVPGLDVDAWRGTKEVARVAARYGIGPAAAMAVTGIRVLVEFATDTARDALSAVDGVDEGESPGDGDSGEHLAPVTDIRSAPSAVLGDATVQWALRLAGVPEGADDEQAVRIMSDPLADPGAAEALVAEALGIERAPAIALGALAESWQTLARRPARVALHWIRAQCRERLGHADEVEADLEAARDLDSSWPPVLEDLARYADDRGDAERAISLLRQAGLPDDDEDLQFLQGLRSPARPNLGRNQPCWCGSGRKYKVCHLGKEALPIESRAPWLYRKMSRFAQTGPFRLLVMSLAERRSAYDTKEFALLRALQDPLVIDAVLFEGGAASTFVAERGFLLPADELALAEQWLEQDRSVFEIEDVRSGLGFRVRNLRTGDRHEVTEHTASRSVRRGHRLLTRVVPVGDMWQIFGGAEPLPMSMEQAALDLCDALAEGSADPEDLVSFATARFAPPELRTTDGQPMVFCTARYRVADVDAVTAELDRRFDGDDHGRWTLTDGQGKRPTVLGSLELEESELSANAMNEVRFRSLQRQLTEIAGLELVNVERTTAAEMMQRAADGQGSGPGDAVDGPDRSELADGPEVRALLEEYARDYEQQWLDMSIPALGGATPRQAADDPTRREDLIRLLDSFDDIDAGPGSMQVDRVRAALGL